MPRAVTVNGVALNGCTVDFQVAARPAEFYKGRSLASPLTKTFELQAEPLPFNNAVAFVVWLTIIKTNKTAP